MMNRYIKTPLKYALPLLFIGSLVLVSISGCTSPTSSNQASNSASPSASASASATPSASPSNAPAPTVTPSADVYQVVVSGPVSTNYGETWTATVYKNGAIVPCSQHGQVSWFINGVPSRSDDLTTWGGSPCQMTHDGNGMAGAPFQHTNAITATAFGVTSAPAPYTDNEIQPPPQLVTGHFGQSNYVVANGTVITAYVSNWQSNPTVAIGDTAHADRTPMTPIGNGWYAHTWEGVIIFVHGSGTGGITLVDNGKIVAYAATTWTNP